MISEYVGKNRKYRIRPWVKCVAVGLSAVLTAGLFNIKLTPKCDDVVQADTGTAQVMNVNLGTLGIHSPAEPADKDAEWSGSYVYFGSYDKEPIKFRVLAPRTQEFNATDADTDTYTMLLDSDEVLFESKYDDSNDKWEDSYLRAFLNNDKTAKYDCSSDGFLKKAFSGIEENAVAQSVKLEKSEKDYEDEDPMQSYRFPFSPLTGEKVFVLDGYEVTRTDFGFSDKLTVNAKNRIKNKTEKQGGKTCSWRVRHYCIFSSSQQSTRIVNQEGNAAVFTSIISNFGISPALNLNLESIMFISQSNTDKSSSFASTVSAEQNDSWNLTLKDSDGFKAEIKNGSRTGAVAKGSTITVSVTDVPKASDGSDYSQISAMLTDEAGTVLAYGKVADSAQTGDIEITIPVDMTEGKYSLKIFAETVRSSAAENLTDYATNMAEIPLTLIPDIDAVEVTGVIAPKAGEELDKSAMCADGRVVTTTLGWKLGSEDVSGKAGYSSIYTACATLTPTEGYAFTAGTTVTIDGNAATYTVLNDDGTLTAAYTFPETEKEPQIIPPVISLSVNAPGFEDVTFGYERPSAKVVNITNTGTGAADIESVSVDNTQAFEVSGSGNKVDAGATLETWYICPKHGLSAGTYTGTVTVTYSGQKTASANVTFTVKKGVMETPDITIDYINEYLLGFEADGVYTINGKPAKVTYTQTSVGRAAIDESWFGTELSIVRKAQDDNYEDSAACIINVPERPAAPAVTATGESIYGHNDGSIAGTNTGMEYRHVLPTEFAVKWTECKGTSIDKLSPGIYKVRVKATNVSFAGVPATTEIKAGVYTGTIKVTGGEGSGTYKTGSVITIKAAEAPEGMAFKGWTVVLGDVKLSDMKNPSATLTVPAGEVQIKAEYEAVKQEEESKQPPEETKEEPTEKTEPTEENKAPSTGDETPIVWLLAIMLISGGVFAGVGKKRLLSK